MLILCLKIFVSRILDVSLSSVRTMFIVKCNKIVASLIAFVEIFIWFYAAKEALVTNIDSIFIVISYALGYATGTFIGTLINERFVSGTFSLKVILNKIDNKNYQYLNDICYDISKIKLDRQEMLFIDVDKRKYNECLNYINKIDINAKVSVSDAKIVRRKNEK